MGIEQVLSAPRSPWQNPFVERLIGTLRRDCLDHVVALNERHLRRIVAQYLDYYHNWRTHLSLSMDAPNPRVVHPSDRGRVVAFPKLGGAGSPSSHFLGATYLAEVLSTAGQDVERETCDDPSYGRQTTSANTPLWSESSCSAEK